MGKLTSTLAVRLDDGISAPAKSAAGALSKLGASGKDLAKLAGASPKLGQLVGDLGKLARAAAQVGEFKLGKGSLEDLRAGFRAAREDAARLKAELERARAASDALKGKRGASGDRAAAAANVKRLAGELRAAESSMTSGRSAILGQVQSLRALRGELSAAGVSVKGLAAAEGQLGARIKSTAAALVKQGRAAERSAIRRETIGTLAGVAGYKAAHGVAHGAEATIETYRDFDKYQRQTQAFGNFSDAEMAAIVSMAIHKSAGTKFNDIQWLQGAKALGGRGVKSGSVMGILPEAANYGQAMSTDLPEAVAALEASIFAFQRDLSTPDKAKAAARRTSDLQVAAAKSFGLTHEDIKGGYEYGALGAQLTGLSEEKLLAFMGLGKKLNISGDAQGNAWRAMTSKFLAPTKKGRESLSAVGINYGDYQKMPERLSVDNFASSIGQQYGVKLDKRSRSRLEGTFTDRKTFSDPTAFAIAVREALKGQVGINSAKDMNKVAGSAERFRQTNVEKVDVNGLLTALMDKIKGGNLALANAFFGEKQGSRVMAALRDEDLWNKSVHKLEETPDGKAEGVAQQMMAGFDGAVSRFENAIKNLETSVGRAFDADGKGGFLTGLADVAGRATQALAELPPRALAVGASLTALAGSAAGIRGAYTVTKGLVGFSGGAAALNGSAVALDASAAALQAAAVSLGGKDVLKDAVKDAMRTGAPAGAAATAALGAATAGVIAGGIVAISSTADQLPKVLEREGPTGVDPATGGAMDTNTMADLAPLIRGLWRRLSGDGEPAASTVPAAAPTTPVVPQGDAKGIEGLGDKAGEVKEKLSELGGMTVRPNADPSALQGMLGTIQQILSGLSAIEAKAALAGAALGRIGPASGSLRQALSDNHT